MIVRFFLLILTVMFVFCTNKYTLVYWLGGNVPYAFENYLPILIFMKNNVFLSFIKKSSIPINTFSSMTYAEHHIFSY